MGHGQSDGPPLEPIHDTQHHTWLTRRGAGITQPRQSISHHAVVVLTSHDMGSHTPFATVTISQLTLRRIIKLRLLAALGRPAHRICPGLVGEARSRAQTVIIPASPSKPSAASSSPAGVTSARVAGYNGTRKLPGRRGGFIHLPFCREPPPEALTKRDVPTPAHVGNYSP